MKKLVLAIDFDGTIVEHKMPAIGALKPYADLVINRLYDKGHTIIIWTCRQLPEHINPMIAFLKEKGIKYHYINENSPIVTYGCYPKIYADLYIDDRGFFFDEIAEEAGDSLWLFIEKKIGYLAYSAEEA